MNRERRRSNRDIEGVKFEPRLSVRKAFFGEKSLKDGSSRSDGFGRMVAGLSVSVVSRLGFAHSLFALRRGIGVEKSAVQVGIGIGIGAVDQTGVGTQIGVGGVDVGVDDQVVGVVWIARIF